ncbi:hypothetical protein CTRG_04695 [Candida tropicalis MYA-3404]|uniref:Uncharacterized protein n=1 Tax=Candida tropicalis (strain ATCC MYA-3404 / T1) TaxID=294747 RepID=C5MF52_CANTT|nr:hypothetical protein CTRG_04695 [Candida tropicalis MYA-3404]EER31912.1 hypothetical protein CTRG_04695 [Candida tropicalis MYA-3404]KAG4405498.1 hypothetical protein JTP64_005534 [Candida tropicalis]
MTQLEIDDAQERLTSSASTNHQSLSHSRHEKSSVLAHLQKQKTSTFTKKLLEFFKINALGYPNDFENYVVHHEASDCSLIAKYCESTTVDLSKQDALSIDSITLNTVHIPHPLVNFMKNEANQQTSTDDQVDVSKELHESPIIVFIHGLGGQMSQFEPLMGLLSQCSETLSLDLPGFGSSKLKFNDDFKIVSRISAEDKIKIMTSIASMKWNDFTTDNIVNIIYEFIQQNVREDKKIVLVGHSMGTHLSIKLAKKLPKHKVEGMILLSPPALIDDTNLEVVQTKPHGTSSMLKIFTYLPWLFNYFRTWDRLEGLDSASVIRQLSKIGDTDYNKLRQFRWNLDVNSDIVLKYINGFQRATTSELITAISNFNDNPEDKHVYEKTLFLCGSNDQMTPVSTIYQCDEFLTKTFGRKVSSVIEVKNVGHSLLLVKPEFISGMILNHLDSKFPERLHLSPAWVLRVKAQVSGDKWGLKNELKWSNLQPISHNITRNNGKDIAPLLGMKTLREEDPVHSPAILEDKFYGEASATNELKGHLIAIIDISADIPPYSPKSFSHIKYWKMSTVSKEVPDQSAIRRFIQLINEILNDNKEVKDPLIAVHCHYGFNRTGFLICCYLIEVLGWSVKEAVDGFKAAKPPGIKHPHFVDALFVRYENLERC